MDDEVQNLHVRIAILETLVDERNKALARQATEYERRLELLNHANEQQVKRNADYVSREVWKTEHTALEAAVNIYRESVSLRLDHLENWRSKMAGFNLGIGTAAGVIGGLIVTLISRLLSH